MASGYVVRKNEYYDSVFLMRIAQILNDEPGVQQSLVLMATQANKTLLAEAGISGSSIDTATPNDLVVAVIAHENAIVEQMLAGLDARLQNISSRDKPSSYRSIDEAAIFNPKINLAVISVPGNYAAREAIKALEHGKHVFLFSNNVSLQEEVELKQLAKKKGLLVMGPDCGTSSIQGVGIGFANIVRRGPIGVVGAAGTGLQEFTSLVHQAGSGISHAIGTGSRDLSDSIGGTTTLMGFEALEADPTTKVIAIVSKPAQPETLQSILKRIRTSTKPVVCCFLGLDHPLDFDGKYFKQASNIDDAVQLALDQVGITHAVISSIESGLDAHLARETTRWSPEQRYIRGVFAGGTFCYQSQQILGESGILAYSNNPLDKRFHLESPETSLEHTLIDMGDDFFTQGKPHPMIDATERRKRILAEADDNEVAVLLLDFILGFVSSPDPVGELIEAIHMAKETVERRGSHLTVVASVCGTDLDPQNLILQKKSLEQAGVLVFPSNVQASRFCTRIILASKGEKNGS